VKEKYFIKYDVPEHLASVKLTIGMAGEVNESTRKISNEYNKARDGSDGHITGYDCVIFTPKTLGLTGRKNLKIMVPRGYGVSENGINSRDPVVQNPPMLVVRAKHQYSPVFVFLTRDAWDRKGDSGSVYCWSNNMSLIDYPKFHTSEEAMKFVNRLKIKNEVSNTTVVPFIPGAQLFYHDGSII
jgi:hypothetical protein